MQYLLAFDVGTTSMKASMFTDAFGLAGTFAREYSLITPREKWVELDPEIYWETLKAAAAYFTGIGIIADDVAAIAITTQGETLIPVDCRGSPLGNAIVWLDTRADKEAGLLSESISSDLFYSKTGMPELAAAMPVSKLLWYKNNKPDIYAKAHKFLLLEDFLLYKLTGRFVSDHSILSSTGYFDITANSYWREILEAGGLDIAKLPEILPSGVIVGKLTPQAQHETGLGPNTLVATSAMDQISSAVGAGNIKPGMITVTVGTALAIAAAVEKPVFDVSKKITIYRHFDDNYIYMPYCPTAAIILKWFKDEFLGLMAEEAGTRGVSPYAAADELASVINPGSDGLILLPHFTGKLSPDYNPNIKGVFWGVGLDTHKGHFIRSILEGVAYMLKENLEFLSGYGVNSKEICLLGGGSRSSLWPQIMADICGTTVETMENPETTALGAAMMAALAAGFYKNAEEICERFIRKKTRYTPVPSNLDAYAKGYAQYRWLYKRLSVL